MSTGKKSSRLLILFMLILFSCKDPYNFATTPKKDLLVVSGSIHQGTGPYRLYLGRTQGALDAPKAEETASITAFDDQGNQEDFYYVKNGQYELAGSQIKGIAGRAYWIEIHFPDGAAYRTDPEILTSNIVHDTASFQVVSGKRFVDGTLVDYRTINTYLSAALPNASEVTYVRWAIDEVYLFYPTCVPNAFHSCPPPCFIFQPVSNFNLNVVNTANYQGHSLTNVLLQAREIDGTFASKHFINVTQYSMTAAAYKYWSAVQSLTARKGSIFDGIPANVHGNVHNINDASEQVFGYFEASAQKITRLGISRGYIPGDLFSGCEYDPARPFGSYYPPACLDCFLTTGAQSAQPDWWF